MMQQPVAGIPVAPLDVQAEVVAGVREVRRSHCHWGRSTTRAPLWRSTASSKKSFQIKQVWDSPLGFLIPCSMMFFVFMFVIPTFTMLRTGGCKSPAMSHTRTYGVTRAAQRRRGARACRAACAFQIGTH